MFCTAVAQRFFIAEAPQHADAFEAGTRGGVHINVGISYIQCVFFFGI